MPAYIYLRDKVGPYRGEVRPYLRHAGENAIASGFAEWPEEDAPAEAPTSTPDPEVDAGALPGDFPGRDALVEADLTTIAAVHDAGDLTEVEGIGPATARKVALYLERLEG